MKSQSIAYLLNEIKHVYWTLKMKRTQCGLYGQAAFKNARTILFLKSGGADSEGGVSGWASALGPKLHKKKKTTLELATLTASKLSK
jgi:hypothetical protein